MQSNHVRIFLSERIPSENRGEAAILEGFVCGLKKYFANYDLTIFSIRLREDRTYYSGLAKVVGIDDRDPYAKIKKINLLLQLLVACLVKMLKIHLNLKDQIYNAFMGADIILQGHDNVYRNGVKARDAVIVFFSKRFGKKVFMPAASIGPFRNISLFKKLICLYVLNNIDLITLRESDSASFLDGLGTKNMYHRLTDLAFLLEPISVEIPWDTNNKVIGFAPTNYVLQSMKYKCGRKLTNLEILCEMRGYLTWLTKTFKCDVILIPHVYGPDKTQDDRILINQILVGLDNNTRVKSLGNRLYSAGELKYLIGKLDMLITCRTHAMIAALGQKTPVIAFTDPERHKTNGILKGLFGLPECLYFVDSWDRNELEKLTKKVFGEIARIRDCIIEISEKARKLALKNVQLMHQKLAQNENDELGC